MSDLDAELAELAGEGMLDDDDDNQSVVSSARSRSHSPMLSSPDASEDEAPEPEKESPKVMAQGKKRPGVAISRSRPKKRARRSRDTDDEEEEGEVEESSNESDGAAPMDLETDASDDEEEPEDLYPLEGKYRDHADKAQLLAMTEIERETKLAERMAQVELINQERQLRTIFKHRNAQSRAHAGGLTRKSTRTKSAPSKNAESTKRSKLDELKRNREERSKNAGTRRGNGDDERSSRRSMTIDHEDGDFVRDTIEEEREITLKDLNRARIGRSGLCKLADYPGFKETVLDCFVRIAIHNDQNSGTLYRICMVKGWPSGKTYTLNNTRKTDQHIRVAHGDSERNFTMDFASDRPFEPEEFRRWKAQLAHDKQPLPTLSHVEHKANALRDLDAKQLTAAELNEVIAKRQGTDKKGIDFVFERGKLQRERDEARRRFDEDEVKRLTRELETLEDEMRRAQGLKAGGDDHLKRLAKVNVENRKRNEEEIRRAEAYQRKKERGRREENRKRQNERKLASNGGTPLNGNGTPSGKSPNGVVVPGSEEKVEGVGVMVEAGKDDVSVGIMKGKRGTMDDFIAGMGLDLEIEL